MQLFSVFWVYCTALQVGSGETLQYHCILLLYQDWPSRVFSTILPNHTHTLSLSASSCNTTRFNDSHLHILSFRVTPPFFFSPHVRFLCFVGNAPHSLSSFFPLHLHACNNIVTLSFPLLSPSFSWIYDDTNDTHTHTSILYLVVFEHACKV